MKNIALRQADPARDFGEIGDLFLFEQGELALETDLMVDYEIHKERIFCLTVAESAQGELLGFNWATRSRFDPNQAYFFIIVKPEQRKQGIGRLLYENVEQATKRNHIKQLEISIRDICSECRAFAEQRGFVEEAHFVELALNLHAFDEKPHNEIITILKNEGFQFISMEALGNTEEAQRKLYRLNDSTSMEKVVPEDHHSWVSFEDFQRKVCQTDWYKPAGQMVAIDTVTGNWAAMSAITHYKSSSSYAYNLHTGVDKRYHGRKLAQATLALALCYARDVLDAESVHTDENARNVSALSIYQELGYVQMPGTYIMKKALGQSNGG